MHLPAVLAKATAVSVISLISDSDCFHSTGVNSPEPRDPVTFFDGIEKLSNGYLHEDSFLCKDNMGD